MIHLHHARAIHGPPPPHAFPNRACPPPPLLPDFHTRLRSLEKLSARAVHSPPAPPTPVVPVQRRSPPVPQPQARRALWWGWLRRVARRVTCGVAIPARFPRVSYSTEVVGVRGAPGRGQLRGGSWRKACSSEVHDGAHLEGIRNGRRREG